MKNKRTKLTAILLSALMAVSTISSVTWATDLFNDGSEDEFATETSTDFVSDNEVTEHDGEFFQNEELLGKAGQSSDGSVQWYEPWDNGVAVQPSAGVGIGVFMDTDGTYKIQVLVGGSITTVDATYAGEEPANCEHPARQKYKFQIEDGKYEAWYYEGGYDAVKNYITTEHHTGAEKQITTKDFSGGTCWEPGEVLTYMECTTCHALRKYNSDGSLGAWDSNHSIYDLARDGASNGTGISYSLEEYLELNYASYKTLGYLKSVSDSASGHKDGKVVQTIIPPEKLYDTSSSGTEFPEYDCPYTDTNAIYEWFKKKANCEIIDGKPSGAMDPTRDAYYYEVTYCDICKLPIKVVKKVIFNANMTEGTRFYMAVSNIYAFINKETKALDTSGRIEEKYFGGVVLADCDVDGIYNICVTTKDVFGENIQNFAYSVVDTKTEDAGHKWEDPIGKVVSPSSVYDFSPNGDPQTGQIKPVKDQESGEWVVRAKDCITEAYYTLEQHCKNPNCKYHTKSGATNPAKAGLSNPEIGGTKKAVPGEHNLYTEDETTEDGVCPARYIDYSRTKYTQIIDEKTGEVDKKHHLEHYEDHVECKLCHWKGWRPSNTPDAVVDHIFVPKKAVDGKEVEATCGSTGSYERIDTCVCQLTDEETRTTVTVPATDEHKFGDNPAQIVWSGGSNGDGEGAVYIANSFVPGVSIHADIVRECTVCHQLDSNGINTMSPKSEVGADVEIKNGPFDLGKKDKADSSHYDYTTLVPAGRWCATPRVRDLEPAKTDPATGIAYRCSTAHATIYVDWVGTVDGKLVKLNEDEVDNAVKYNVPYYASAAEYAARTSHTPGKPQKEGDQIVTRCTVCGDIVAQEDDNTPSVGVPTVTATSVDFDTVNVSWTKVDGATAYRLYYRSSDEGISKWAKIRTFTGETTSYAVNGLTTGSKYRFTVRAEVTQDGKTTLGDYSKKGAVAVPKLTAPEIKSVTASGKTTKVTWSRVDGASGYIVFRNSQRVGTVTKGSKVTWTDKKPVSGAKYQVRAYRTEDKKNYKSELSEPK